APSADVSLAVSPDPPSRRPRRFRRTTPRGVVSEPSGIAAMVDRSPVRPRNKRSYYTGRIVWVVPTRRSRQSDARQRSRAASPTRLARHNLIAALAPVGIHTSGRRLIDTPLTVELDDGPPRHSRRASLVARPGIGRRLTARDDPPPAASSGGKLVGVASGSR